MSPDGLVLLYQIDREIQEIIKYFTQIKNMWYMARNGNDVSRTLPIYDFGLTNEKK